MSDIFTENVFGILAEMNKKMEKVSNKIESASNTKNSAGALTSLLSPGKSDTEHIETTPQFIKKDS